MVLDFGGLTSLAMMMDYSREPFSTFPGDLKIWITLFCLRLLLVGVFYPVILSLGLEELADQLVIAPVLGREKH